MKASFKKHTLQFIRPAGTSRGVLNTKDTWFLIVEDEGRRGLGECAMFRGLSYDDRPDYEAKLQWVCDNIGLGPDALYDHLRDFPAIQLGVETAFRSLQHDDPFTIFPSTFVTDEAPITINGLIWMGSEQEMTEQVKKKILEGFKCIKLKIGALDFETELNLLKSIRSEFSSEEIEIRVDANGAFSANEALEKLKRLSDLQLHSIEQPIKQGQWAAMARLCEATPLPIALDEELIGIVDVAQKTKLLEVVKPQYIILKPSLVGGFKGSDEWIQMAEQGGINWWITSALESNIGLNAISQFTFVKNSKLPQGLGTGSLFTNNVPSPLEVQGDSLVYNKGLQWNTKEIFR